MLRLDTGLNCRHLVLAGMLMVASHAVTAAENETTPDQVVTAIEDNPTVSWPDDRKQIKAGTLTISSATPQKGAECEQINFDPLVMSDDIEPSTDPILLFRSPAYAISFAKRLTGD